MYNYLVEEFDNNLSFYFNEIENQIKIEKIFGKEDDEFFQSFGENYQLVSEINIAEKSKILKTECVLFSETLKEVFDGYAFFKPEAQILNKKGLLKVIECQKYWYKYDKEPKHFLTIIVDKGKPIQIERNLFHSLKRLYSNLFKFYILIN